MCRWDVKPCSIQSKPAGDTTNCRKKGPPAVGLKELKMLERSKRSKKRHLQDTDDEGSLDWAKF